MKRIILFTAIACLSLSNIYAQKKLYIKPNDSIVFEATVHNFGVIKKGSDASCVFKFVNKGTKPLVLKNVVPSCGCTAAEWTKSPIKPGETGYVKVKYNSNIVGIFNKSVDVYSNASNSPETLYIDGKVVKND